MRIGGGVFEPVDTLDGVVGVFVAGVGGGVGMLLAENWLKLCFNINKLI